MGRAALLEVLGTQTALQRTGAEPLPNVVEDLEYVYGPDLPESLLQSEAIAALVIGVFLVIAGILMGRATRMEYVLEGLV